MNDDDGPAWGAVAHRGALSMTVRTRRRALRDRLPNLAFTPFFGTLHPAGRPDFGPIGFDSVASLEEFCREMAPRVIEVLGIEGEAERLPLLQLALDRAASGAVH